MQLQSTWALIITAIPALVVILSGIYKLTGSKQVMDGLGRVGVATYAKPLGIAEILFAILFVYPPTNGIGFILLVCYFSGALATDLSHKNKMMAPLIILGVLFIVEYLVQPELFGVK